MNIDNNIGGSAHQSRSQHIEKRTVEPVAPEQQQTVSGGGRLSFVNVLETTSLANVLWTVSNDADASNAQGSEGATSQLDSAWFRQAYTEH
ncbi:hypothetical protein [Agrobacterium vaccinii]|uniref:hypothetical protein n=1 Tax=Agrobacterium vaccinii TaxID=2735528 RepID=UPI000DD09B16|nr:hypothetical protein [Agrobacterium vaccinii]UHS55944.1 hypothetical protein HRS00_03500 [Agrobacterium vaccinii]